MKIEKSMKAIDNWFDNMTPEQLQEAKQWFEDHSDKRPEGWNELSEDNLPLVDAISALEEGGKFINMRHKNGSEDKVWVGADGFVWWHLVGKNCGYTHWFK